MKQIRLVKLLVALAAMAAVTTAVAQQSTTTSTTVNPVTGSTTTTESSTVSTQGTITTYTPSSEYITFRGATNEAPVRYYYDKQTTILDPEGRSVTWSAVRPDTPATVYYVREGDRMIVRKIIMSKPGTVYEKKETTTTTTTTKP